MHAPCADPVLLLTGPPGAGKTTAARLVAASFERAVCVESDSFFRFIESGYVEPWKPESHRQNEVVMRIVAEAACGYASAGYFTIVEGILIPGWFFEPLRDSLRSAGHQVAFAILRAPLDICKSRVVARDTARLSVPRVVDRLWHEFADLGALESHVIEVGTQSTAEVAELLRRRLADGDLAT